MMTQEKMMTKENAIQKAKTVKISEDEKKQILECTTKAVEFVEWVILTQEDRDEYDPNCTQEQNELKDAIIDLLENTMGEAITMSYDDAREAAIRVHEAISDLEKAHAKAGEIQSIIHDAADIIVRRCFSRC